MVKTKNVSPSMLFVGSRGTGKTTTGRIFAAALNCEKPTDGGDCCASCASCVEVQNGTSFSVMEVDAASNGLVDDIRGIKELVSYAHEGDWRVIMLDEAHSMSPAAFNALLKVLEEPPPFTVFVLLTTEANKILDTVASRSMSFEFRRLTTADIIGRLRLISEEKGLDASEPLLLEIAERAQGGMRDAVMLLDQVSTIGITDVAGYRELFGIRDVSFPLLRAALDGDHAGGIGIIEDYFLNTGDASGMVNDLVLLVKDLLVIQSGGDPKQSSDVDPEERKELARAMDPVRLVGVIKVLWDLKGRVRAVDNDQRAAMHMAYALISDALQVRSPSAPIPTETSNGNGAARRVSIADIKDMVSRYAQGSEGSAVRPAASP
jgi:DNA polymerase-3 subunit gamma/tau